MSQLVVVMVALFGQMERTYAIERAVHARAVATSKGKRIGRPSVVDPTKLDYAAHLRDEGLSISQIVEKIGITRSSLYRHLPPRPPETLTAEDEHETR
ncbi:helix-turn-helix domain-containing protein [Arthrobacter sp. STN4]|uniref:helix-turn-helix domain-containing protein n=1 Tax=Arthrobacter sp. STN4 TaxID=2923276 RepID=UPI00211A3C93|nr:helix-turn-helix domain-containing protein [Arthrobacter sp. STN4]MCQ9165472.1 helix-turn-helix domain-containing protein [Arthrobacter sp. STN4]